LRQRAQFRAIRRNPDAFHARERRHAAHDVRQIRAHQRRAASEPELAEAHVRGHAHHPQDFVRRQMVGFSFPTFVALGMQ